MNYYGYCADQFDMGPEPYVVHLEELAAHNPNFRTAIWTGELLQMTLMCIPPCGEIGLEIHPETDQFLRIERGTALVQMGKSKRQLTMEQKVCRGDAIFIPAGTWHNMTNIGRTALKVSSIYAPPNHRRGTVHRTKAEAEKEEY